MECSIWKVFNYSWQGLSSWKKAPQGMVLLPHPAANRMWNWAEPGVLALYTQWPHTVECEQIWNSQGVSKGWAGRRPLLAHRGEIPPVFLVCFFSYVSEMVVHLMLLWPLKQVKMKTIPNTRALFWGNRESPSLYSTSAWLAGLSTLAPQRKLYG